MLDEIPPIPEIPEELRRAAQEGRLVPFVGAGASRLAKCPSWEEFATGFLKQLVGHRVLNFSQVEQILNQHLSPRIILSLARAIAEQNGISPDYEDIIHRGRDVTDSDGRRLYGALARLGNVFVTTNYDYWLDRVLDPSPLDLGAPDSQSTPKTDVIQRNVIYKVEDFSPHQLTTENSVIHLHGSLRDPNTMVMTTGQYLNHYRNDQSGVVGTENKVLSFLRHLFAQKVVMFVGYGMNELEILEYITLKIGSTGRSNGTRPKHYMLQPHFSHDLEIANHLSAYYENECGITLLPYLRDENDHHQLLNVLEHFAQKIPVSSPLDIDRLVEMKALLDD